MNPSGEQVELTFGEQRAVVVGVGAGLRTYTVGDRTILDGYGVGDVCPSGRGQLLAPWPNASRSAATSSTGVRSSCR